MKKTTKKSSKKKPSNDLTKTKSLFDHLKAIYEVQDPNYFGTLTESDKKSYNVYMLNRLISMNPNQALAVAIIQKYNTLDPELHYTFLINVISKGKQWNEYIKARSEESYPPWLVARIAQHFEISTKESVDYLDIFYHTEIGKLDLRKLLQLYGTNDKELREAGL
jgi:hypothetical protein